MPTTYFSRVMTTAVVLLAALYLIFPTPSKLWQPGLTLIQRTDLKPGIDMVGGVRLIYEIEPPKGGSQGGQSESDLSTRVMEALKIRVDPTGLRNLVWRPQGATRLEVQMPASPGAAEAPKIKAAFNEAQIALEATNVRATVVTNAIEKLSGDARKARLAALAQDSQTRQKLFTQMAATWDQIQALRANPQKLSLPLLAAKLAGPTQDYQDQTQQIETTNLTSDNLQSILDESASTDTPQKTAGDAALAKLKQDSADFPLRVKAIDNFAGAYRAYLGIKNAISDASDLKRLLQGSGVLEFHILADHYTDTDADLQAMDARLQPGGKGPLPQPGDMSQWMEVDKVDEFDRPGFPPETREWNGKHYMLVLMTPEASLDKRTHEKWGLSQSYPTADANGGMAIGFTFDTTGARLFGDLTTYWTNHMKQLGTSQKARLAIVLDDKLASAPNLDEPITSGQGSISSGSAGGFPKSEADYMINTLTAGSLPAQLSSEPISEEQVGPTLGADNLYRGLVACGFGLVVVAIFLIGYYYVAGVVAFFAVCMNLVLILGTMAAMSATFTLPSIAGIVLTVGTAVDANVLIFERLREEQHRGLPLRMALTKSYQQARSAIIDSNMTSIITSICLYIFGSEEVKGFGLTLIIGIVASLFTALYVTKTIFGIMIDRFGVRHLGSFPLTFPKWDRALKPNWDWMGKAWIFYAFSTVALIIGLSMFVIKVREGKMMDIEFASGTSVQFGLVQPMKQEDVRKLIDAASDKDPTALPSPSVVAVGTDEMHYEVVTPSADRVKAKAAILAAMTGKLQIVLPSNFDGVDRDYEDARGKTIMPITGDPISIDGFTPAAAKDHVGGVIIVLKNLSPKLKADDIRQRLDNERLSSSGSENGFQYIVESPNMGTPTDTAVITGWNSSVAFSADEGQWAQDLAKPLWNLTRDAVHNPPSFEKETNFDPQVAGEMQRQAFLALFFSIAAIMVYIWVRFGNLKYATATVVALLHDTVFTLAALGFAHYIADGWHHNFLQIEPFRINLTVVAGILTIMGYSMIDTIVVFDRIRENRGKYGHLDRNVINDAINQTLSRTLLTAGATIMTVSFMYFMGGEGIHGFTFVLLIGILVGTYSSVAIAAPLLLWGKEPQHATGGRGVPGGLQRAAG